MTTTKKILTSAFAVVFTALISLCLSATTALASVVVDIPTTYVRDHYQLMDNSTLKSMESQAAQLSDQYDCNVYLTVVDNIGSYSVRQYAEAYWNQFDLGRGPAKDGIMFLIAVDSRDYVTITHGQGRTGGITMFTDYRIGQIESDVTDKLHDNEWVEGAQVYLDDVSATMSFYVEKGEPWDSDNDPTDSTGLIIKLLLTFVLPMLIAGFMCSKWAREMKTARERQEADDYLNHNTLNLTRKTDRFINTTRSVVKIESESKGGGSSISSSGFGGSSGGKF